MCLSLQVVGVSAMTGEGMDELFEAVQEARQEYYESYKPELERVIKERQQKAEKEQQENLANLLKDLKMEKNDQEQ